jgi:hypothetical protein
MSKPVYLVAQIDVKDYESYLSEYGFPLPRQLRSVAATLWRRAESYS